jgi:Rap1a immunity proteins
MRALAAIPLASSFVVVAGKVSLAADSGNEFLPHCREGASNSFMGGFCTGMIETVAMYETAMGRICPPLATRGQMRAVVVKYLENHPERLHEDIHLLAQQALQTAWPCKSK